MMGLPEATPPLLPGPARTMWSCVLDDRPAAWSACVAWLATALGPGGIAASDLVVHHVAPLRPDIAALCTALGVRTVAVAPFDARSPRCNKLRQADTAFGHTGFPGTSVWIDPERGAIFVLLTNRIHPNARDVDFNEVRRRFHRAALRLL